MTGIIVALSIVTVILLPFFTDRILRFLPLFYRIIAAGSIIATPFVVGSSCNVANHTAIIILPFACPAAFGAFLSILPLAWADMIFMGLSSFRFGPPGYYEDPRYRR